MIYPKQKYQLKYPLRQKGIDISVVSENPPNATSLPSRQAPLKSQGQALRNIASNDIPSILQNNLAVTTSLEVKCPRRRRGRNVSVSENSMNRTSSKQQVSMKSRGRH